MALASSYRKHLSKRGDIRSNEVTGADLLIFTPDTLRRPVPRSVRVGAILANFTKSTTPDSCTTPRSRAAPAPGVEGLGAPDPCESGRGRTPSRPPGSRGPCRH